MDSVEKTNIHRVEEDVGSLEVAVDDLPLRSVQEREATGSAYDYLEPQAPGKRFEGGTSCPQKKHEPFSTSLKKYNGW